MAVMLAPSLVGKSGTIEVAEKVAWMVVMKVVLMVGLKAVWLVVELADLKVGERVDQLVVKTAA